jgi:hypothetical protein
MESVTLGDLMEYVKTPYFVGFCIIILLLVIYKYRDSFTAAVKKPEKAEEIDDLITSIHQKQERLKRAKK